MIGPSPIFYLTWLFPGINIFLRMSSLFPWGFWMRQVVGFMRILHDALFNWEYSFHNSKWVSKLLSRKFVLINFELFASFLICWFFMILQCTTHNSYYGVQFLTPQTVLRSPFRYMKRFVNLLRSGTFYSLFPILFTGSKVLPGLCDKVWRMTWLRRIVFCFDDLNFLDHFLRGVQYLRVFIHTSWVHCSDFLKLGLV